LAAAARGRRRLASWLRHRALPSHRLRHSV